MKSNVEMKSSVDILDELSKENKRRGETGSDYALATVLCTKPPRISDIRNGRQTLSKSLCRVAAYYLGVEYGALVTIAAADREKDKTLKDSLLKVAAAGLRNHAVVAALIAVPMLMHAATAVADVVYYVKSALRERLCGLHTRTL